MRVLNAPWRVKTKYLVRLRGTTFACGFCLSEKVVGAVIDPDSNDSMACCADHFDPQAAIKEGLRPVSFVTDGLKGAGE